MAGVKLCVYTILLFRPLLPPRVPSSLLFHLGPRTRTQPESHSHVPRMLNWNGILRSCRIRPVPRPLQPTVSPHDRKLPGTTKKTLRPTNYRSSRCSTPHTGLAIGSFRSRHYSSPSSAHPTSSSSPSRSPTIALIKQYVPGPTSVHDTYMNDANSRVHRHDAISSKDTTDTEETTMTSEEASSRANALEMLRLAYPDGEKANDEMDVAVFVGAASSTYLEADQSHLKNNTEANWTNPMVKLKRGSTEERMVRAHGIASLNYLQALDIVHNANGTKRSNHFRQVYNESDLADAPMSLQPKGKLASMEVPFLPKDTSWIFRRLKSISNMVVSAFLPTGYPHSVSTDYTRYYTYLWLMNVAGSFSYVMSMTALLQAVGLGAGAVGAAAAVSWVLKDGLGAIGMILAAKVLGDANTFDSNTIRSKFRADVLHNLGVAMELLTMFFPTSFLFLAAAANTSKGIAGLINGACKASINQRMAIANNLGDITAKGQVQGLAAYLTGLSLGVLYDRISPHLVDMLGPQADQVVGSILTSIGIDALATQASNTSAAIIWILFLASCSLHLFFSFKCLRSLALPSLNQERVHILVSKYLESTPVLEASDSNFGRLDRDDLVPPNLHASQIPDSSIRSKLPTPFDIAKEGSQRILMPLVLDSSPRIVLGADVSQTFLDCPEQLQPAVKRALGAPYLIHGDRSGTTISILLATEATSKHMLRAFFHACTVRSILLAEESTSDVWSDANYEMVKCYVDREYPHFEALLEDSGWRTDQVLLGPKPIRADWTLAMPDGL